MTALEIIFPVELGKGRVRYAQGIKAGRWVFATGHMASDFLTGIKEKVIQPRLPHLPNTKYEREAVEIYADFETILQSAGSDLSNVVRVDQYYTTWKAVDPYHVIRRAKFSETMPCSTSVLQENLLLPEAEIDVQMIAVIPKDDFRPLRDHPSVVKVPPTSGYTPVIKVGDFIFLAGNMATDEKGMASETKLVYGQRWGGTQVKKETEYIIKKRIEPVLDASNSSLEMVLKAQVYLSDIEDVAPFNTVWSKYFGDNPPTTSIIPTSGFGHESGKIEINILALEKDVHTRKETIDAGLFTGFNGQANAIKAGELLFVSALMAVDKNGLVDSAKIDHKQPFFSSNIQSQMRVILRNAQKICDAAGTSLENIVRIQQFHTDLNDFYPAYQIWQEFLPGFYLPFSAVEVPNPLPIPGCKVLLDLWFYVP